MKIRCPGCHKNEMVRVLEISALGFQLECLDCGAGFFIKNDTFPLEQRLLGQVNSNAAEVEYPESERKGTLPPEKNREFSYGIIEPGVRLKKQTGFLSGKSSFCGILIIFIVSALLLLNTIPISNKPDSEINHEIGVKLRQHHFDDARAIAQKHYKPETQKFDRWVRLINGQEIEIHRSQKARAFFKKGIILTKGGSFSEAVISFSEALKRFERSNDKRFITLTNLNLGLCYRHLGREQESLIHLEEALSVSKENHFKKYEAKALQGIGHTHYRLGQFEMAYMALDDARDLHRYLNDPRGEALDWLILGAVEQKRDPMEAESCYKRSLAIARKIGDNRLYSKANGLLKEWLEASREGSSGNPIELETL